MIMILCIVVVYGIFQWKSLWPERNEIHKPKTSVKAMVCKQRANAEVFYKKLQVVNS